MNKACFSKEMSQLDYLEGVLDAVSRLSNPDGFQHSCVPQLSKHQTVVETQRQLSDTKCKRNVRKIKRRSKSAGSHREKQQFSFSDYYLLGIGANTLDEVRLRLIESLHQLIE